MKLIDPISNPSDIKKEIIDYLERLLCREQQKLVIQQAEVRNIEELIAQLIKS